MEKVNEFISVFDHCETGFFKMLPVIKIAKSTEQEMVKDWFGSVINQCQLNLTGVSGNWSQYCHRFYSASSLGSDSQLKIKKERNIMWPKSPDIPACTEVSCAEALVSFVPCTPEPEMMIVLAAWMGLGLRMAVSATVHHSKAMSHHPMEAAMGKPRFFRDSGVWLRTQLLLCSFFTAPLSDSPTFSLGWPCWAGQELAPHLPLSSLARLQDGSLSKPLQAPADSQLMSHAVMGRFMSKSRV